MTALGAQIFALLGLRALSEYDYPEYSRATELSKTELDSQLADLLANAESEDDATVDEARSATAQFEQLKNDLRGRQEADFLLRQMHASWLQRAQLLALAFVKSSEGRSTAATSRTVEHGLAAVAERSPLAAEDYLRLGVMLLLRALPGYEAIFEYPLQGKAVDCILRPTSGNGPVVLLEGKQRLLSSRQIEEAGEQLRKFARAWGTGALTAILTASMAQPLRADFRGILRPHGQKSTRRPPTYLLEFDVENNQFVGPGADHFLSLLHETLTRLE